MELLLTNSGEVTKSQVVEIWCSSKSARTRPANEVQLQLISPGKLEVGGNQFGFYPGPLFRRNVCSGSVYISVGF